MHLSRVETPLGPMRLAAEEEGLCGLWFEGAKHAPEWIGEEEDTPVITEAKRWLSLYFSGEAPDFTPPLHLMGTPFQRAVWRALLAIPCGTVTTYGALADDIARACGRVRPAPQAVGQAVGRNPVALIVPCHRVVGASGKLTAYAGGLARKAALLRLEGADLPGLR